MPSRTVALIGAVCLTIGWLLASTITPPVARVQTLPERTAAPPAEHDPTFAEGLHERLRHVPDPPASRRNPFVFGAGDRRERAAIVRHEPARRAAEVPPPTPRGPEYFLAGLGISADVRTAVITDGDAVHIVRVNDVVGEYTVAEITDDAVTLAAAGGERHVLRLR